MEETQRALRLTVCLALSPVLTLKALYCSCTVLHCTTAVALYCTLYCTALGPWFVVQVMYIGVDSAGLVHALPKSHGRSSTSPPEHQHVQSSALRVVDMCTGSGVQALTLLQASAGTRSDQPKPDRSIWQQTIRSVD